MKVGLPNNMDFLAGLVFSTIALIALYVGWNYPIGTSLRMGPGYFPRVLGFILLGFGVFIMLRGLHSGAPVEGRWGWKPLAFITAGIIAFAYLMANFGMIPALVTMFFVTAFGGHEFRFIEVAGLTLAMCILAAGIFVYGLGLPYPMIEVGSWRF